MSKTYLLDDISLLHSPPMIPNSPSLVKATLRAKSSDTHSPSPLTPYPTHPTAISPASRSPPSVPSTFPSFSSGLRTISHYINAIWLFTYSDIKTIVAPSFAFGLFTASIAASFGIDPSPSWIECLQRAPLMLLWSWINLLPFTIDNQRRPATIAEDNLNKPWRTLPSKLMTPQQAFIIMLVLYPAAFLLSLKIGGARQCVALVFLGIYYNDLRGADSSCLMRNFINACGFICHISAPLEVALGGRAISLDDEMVKWLVVIGSIVFSTVQTQDMYDQAGDSLLGRKTVPLVIGDGPARWTIAIPMAFWAFFCPWYWDCSLAATAVFASLGLVIATRSLNLRTVAQDKSTFRLWNLWMVCLYALPL